MTDPLLTLVARAIAAEIARQEAGEWTLKDNLTVAYLDQGEVDFGLVAQAALSVIREQEGTRIEELEAENGELRMQLVATLAGTYNVAPHATAILCGRLDENGELLASVKEMAASLHSIKPDAARPLPAPPLEKM